MGFICDNPCWPTKCFFHDTKVHPHCSMDASAFWSHPTAHTPAAKYNVGAWCCLNLLSIAKPKHPKGQDVFLRAGRTYWADGRGGDLGCLVFNHHCLNPLLLTHSLIFAKSLVTGTAQLFARAVVRTGSVQSAGGGLQK